MKTTQALLAAREALQYHTEQTRPIQRTIDTLALIDAALSEQAAQPAEQVPGYVLVPVETLEGWKTRVNTLASLTTKQDRHNVGIDLKTKIAKVIATSPKPAVQPAVCKCSMRTKLVGDGCAICNPGLAAYFAQPSADKLDAERVVIRNQALEDAARMISEWPIKNWSQDDCAKAIRAMLATTLPNDGEKS